jgi:hypothetical protein
MAVLDRNLIDLAGKYLIGVDCVMIIYRLGVAYFYKIPQA